MLRCGLFLIVIDMFLRALQKQGIQEKIVKESKAKWTLIEEAHRNEREKVFLIEAFIFLSLKKLAVLFTFYRVSLFFG